MRRREGAEGPRHGLRVSPREGNGGWVTQVRAARLRGPGARVRVLPKRFHAGETGLRRPRSDPVESPAESRGTAGGSGRLGLVAWVRSG